MMAGSGDGGSPAIRQAWEEEVLAGHRWGRMFEWFQVSDDRGAAEHARLKELWESAPLLDESSEKIVDQIVALEICNWRLEESILALCHAIGEKEAAPLCIGHMRSVSEERWRRVWAYYLALLDWLPAKIPSAHGTLLRMCDPERKVQDHILGMLGDGNVLKELYVQRFCLCLQFWLGGFWASESPQMTAHTAAVFAVEKEIKELDPEGRVLPEFVLKSEGNGRLQPCNHKAFRRYDLIVSSIGAGKWRAVMPRRGTDGFERADLLDEYLSPTESWIAGQTQERAARENELSERIHEYLGEPDDVKIFLASLLASLLRSQHLPARTRAENAVKELNRQTGGLL